MPPVSLGPFIKGQVSDADKLHLLSSLVGLILVPMAEAAAPGFHATYADLFTAAAQGLSLGYGATLTVAAVKSVSLPQISIASTSAQTPPPAESAK
jgi:hypothetical protein